MSNDFSPDESHLAPVRRLRPPSQHRNQTLATISLVTGILSLCYPPLSMCCWSTVVPVEIITPLIGFVAVTTGGIALMQIRRGGGGGKGSAIAGMICGGLTILLVIVLFALAGQPAPQFHYPIL